MAVLPPELRPASIDEKLARGLVRQEMRERGFAGLDPVLKKCFQDILDTLVTPVSRKGRIVMADAAALMRRIEARVGAEPRLLRIERRSSGRTLSRQRMHDEIAVATYRRLTEREDFGGTTLHVIARPGSALLNLRPLPFSFIPHLPERYLNRRGEAWEAAGGAVARGLMESLPLLCLLARPAAMLPERRLALPLGQGLVLGVVEESTHWEFGVVVDGEDSTELGTVSSRYLVTPAGCALGSDRPLAYKGMTYIAPGMLRPEQERLLERLRDISRRFAPVADPFLRMALWPHALGREILDDAGEPVVKHFHDLCVEAAELLSERWAVRAMGGSEPAPGGPLPPDTPIAYQAKAADEHAVERIRALVNGTGMRP